MEITFATRSRFIDLCEDAIRRWRDELDAGGIVRVELEEGGYAGRITVTIRADDPVSFGTDWTSTDESRFPARIKAAATALRDCGCEGCFLVIHTDGLLEMSRV